MSLTFEFRGSRIVRDFVRANVRQDWRNLPPIVVTDCDSIEEEVAMNNTDEMEINEPEIDEPVVLIGDDRNVVPVSIGQIEREHSECGVRRFHGQRQIDNSHHTQSHRPRRFSNFEAELHKLDAEMELAMSIIDADPESAVLEECANWGTDEELDRDADEFERELNQLFEQAA